MITPSTIGVCRSFLILNQGSDLILCRLGVSFGTQYIADQFPITVLYELAAPSVPDELIEDIMSLYNSTMAGIFGKFSDGCGISYEYSKQINGVRKVGCNPQNFSAVQGEKL